jgi:hypothetical protein
MRLKVVRLNGQIFTDPHWHFDALMRCVQTMAPDSVDLYDWATDIIVRGLVEYGYKEGDQYDWRGPMGVEPKGEVAL